MAGELQLPWLSGKNVYFIVRDANGQVWDTGALIFEAYSAGSLGDYDIAAAEQGSSGYYTAAMPSVDRGEYYVTAYERAGASPAEGDLNIGQGSILWTGVAAVPLGDAFLLHRFASEVTLTSSALVVKDDDGNTLTTQTVSDNGTTQTQGEIS